MDNFLNLFVAIPTKFVQDLNVDFFVNRSVDVQLSVL